MGRRASFTVAIAATLALSSGATAHTKSRAAREIVRISGTVLAKDADCDRDLVTVRVANRTVRLCRTEVRRVAVVTVEAAREQPLPDTFELQAERHLLAPLTAAGAGHRATVLGEWRPGRRDVFLIALDVCPCETSTAGE